MTRKHFEALAAEFKYRRPFHEGTPALGTSPHYEAWQGAAEGVADVCARFNPNFDRTRFLTACGVEERK